MHKVILIPFLLIMNSVSADLGDTGLEISVAGDMLYSQGLNKSSSGEDKLKMRGAEMTFFAPLDHRFDGTLSAAAHDENGETVFELHELYLGSTKMIPRSRFKIGQYFLGIGRLNHIHQHDWDFIEAPKVHETFLGEEGVFDAGAEYGYLLPTDFYLDLTAGITSGHRFGHAHTSGSKPLVPTHYLKLATFNEFSSTNGLLFSLSYLGRTDEQKNQIKLTGAELVAKWREGKRIIYQIVSEAWFRTTKDRSDAISEQTGLYIFNQYGFNDNYLLGLRLDGYKDLSKTNALTNKKINNIDYSAALEFTWISSEFVKTRFGLTHSFTREEGVTINKDTKLLAQFVFILGTHPAHSF